ncbi:DALR anticodon-binding domain-containing protein [Plectonema radiosum NIES-515]|uniref:DALR anticodon-binding domain-containing protein n=1 Tax=Plectonema radiosum NIES-515 TaxID=2986073 RepID=A0ABT3B231_9CYAN|nr:DALR anticodon-binding domain-containing protein [Plectonema radiosum]MCV3215426.1 DALR anticodon-binding domain-containing protein [Plectonema radiosum NIES-515]
MLNLLQVSKNTAIKRLINSYLLSALSIDTNTNIILSRENDKIPLYKSRDINRILYISGVALQLSKSQNRKGIDIACAIASHLSANCGDEFIIEIVPPGYIHFVLTDPILAGWLQHLVEGMGERKRGGERERGGGETRIKNSSHLFALQYAHARCCSLIRLAQQEKLIQLGDNNVNTSSAMFSVISPNPIPWLNSDRKLRFSHSASHRLISQLVQVVDDLELCDEAGSVNWEKAAINLSQAFEVFWCNCRIWGEVKITSPELSQARLGLVIATQSVLRFLLEEKLGVFALVEL